MFLKLKKADIFRMYPFTIILKNREEGAVQPLELKIDPGSKTTGVALVARFERGRRVIWACEINHRGTQIRKLLLNRRQTRRARKYRKTRYRKPRFKNRTRPKGWLPPSLRSRVENVFNWAKRLLAFVPTSEIAVETVRFDLQAMENPEISGVEYRRGEPAGYELREYLLEKWAHRCAYCGSTNVPLEIDHIVPRSKGGTDRVSNMLIACRDCNHEKGNRNIRDSLAGKPEILKKVLSQAKTPLKDAAVVNAARFAIGNRLKELGLPISFWSGGRTRYNRARQDYAKTHWLDAVCVGKSGENVFVPQGIKPLVITAKGRGSRQMCRMDRFGFPRTSAKRKKIVCGFKTGDLVRAVVPRGKHAGCHIGRVSVRTSGSFDIKTASGTKQGISWKYCSFLQHADGYQYDHSPAFLSTHANTMDGVSCGGV